MRKAMEWTSQLSSITTKAQVERTFVKLKFNDLFEIIQLTYGYAEYT